MDRFIVEPTQEYIERYQIFDNSTQEAYDPICLCNQLNDLYEQILKAETDKIDLQKKIWELEEDIEKYKEIIMKSDFIPKKIEVII